MADIIKKLEKGEKLRSETTHGGRQGSQFGGRNTDAIEAESNEAQLIRLNKDDGESFMRTVGLMLQLAAGWNLDIFKMAAASNQLIVENDRKRTLLATKGDYSGIDPAEVMAYNEQIMKDKMLGIPDVFWSNFDRAGLERLKLNDKNFYGSDAIGKLNLLPGTVSVPRVDRSKSGKLHQADPPNKPNAPIKIASAGDVITTVKAEIENATAPAAPASVRLNPK